MAVRHQVNRQSHEATRARHGQPRALRRGAHPTTKAALFWASPPLACEPVCEPEERSVSGSRLQQDDRRREAHEDPVKNETCPSFIDQSSHRKQMRSLVAVDPLFTAVPSVRRTKRQCHHSSRIRLGHRRTQIRSDRQRKQRHHRHQPRRRRAKRSSAASLLDSVLSQEAWTRCLRRRRHQRMVNRRLR